MFDLSSTQIAQKKRLACFFKSKKERFLVSKVPYTTLES